MKLSVWAKAQGISYKTAWRMWKAGTLPVPVEQLATGTVIVHAEAATSGEGVALYARVSSADQRGDLDRQVARLSAFAATVDHAVDSGKPAPDGMGGFGFDPKAEPHPDCPECGGEGMEDVHVADTRKLRGPAKVLYAGAKRNKHRRARANDRAKEPLCPLSIRRSKKQRTRTESPQRWYRRWYK